jgi:hypothetical protein
MFNGSEMQVYVVTAGDFYESDDHCSLWDCKSAAIAKRDELREEYDWAEVNLQTVHMGSAIAA